MIPPGLHLAMSAEYSIEFRAASEALLAAAEDRAFTRDTVALLNVARFLHNLADAPRGTVMPPIPHTATRRKELRRDIRWHLGRRTRRPADARRGALRGRRARNAAPSHDGRPL